MKTRNKIFISCGVILLVFVFAGYGLVSAYGPWNGPKGYFHSRSAERGYHQGFRDKDRSDFLFWMMDKRAEELKLTDAQKEKYEALKANIKEHLQDSMADHMGLRDQFHSEISKENPDIGTIVGTIKTKINEMSDIADQILSLFMDFYDSLDASQQHMLLDEIKEQVQYHQS